MKCKIFLMLGLLTLLSISGVSAQVVNGGFESGTFSSWGVVGLSSSSVASAHAYTGGYGAWLDANSANGWMTQTVNAANYGYVEFDAYIYESGGGGSNARVSLGSTYHSLPSTSSWAHYKYAISGTSSFTIKFMLQPWSGERVYMKIDNVELTGYTIPNPYITWTTHPTESWAVGNYSTLIVAVPKDYEFDFYYKQPNGTYAITPIQKSLLGPYWNDAEGMLYEDYIKTCYHSRHGTYSGLVMVGETGVSEKHVYVPYFDVTVDLPDVIVIPIPDVYVDPPQWNVTIPPAYENISWLIEYTDFWDGVASSINYTQYATVGLLLPPLEMLNDSIYTIYVYADSSSVMLQGFEHCALIVMVGWDVIPASIQAIFIGAASLGVVIFLLHRRT